MTYDCFLLHDSVIYFFSVFSDLKVSSTRWYYITCQTWSSRDLSLGLETSRDPFLQVLVSFLVLNLGELVLVLDISLGLGLGLETVESWSWIRKS